MMAQNRLPPAFQEYAASMIARIEYRILTLVERGLLMTVRLECWVNFRLPSDPVKLARMLSVTVEEIKQALPAIMPFLAIHDGHLICPELETYRAHLQSIKDKKAEGGKRGAEITNGRRKTDKTAPRQGVEGSAGNPRLSRDSLVKLSSVKSIKTQSTEYDDSNEQWLNEYSATSAASRQNG